MTLVTAGIDVGSSAVKAVVLEHGDRPKLLSHLVSKIRKREVAHVVREAFEAAADHAGVDELAYVATTGEGEEVPFSTGHFYGMTAHARGALFLNPDARCVLDAGALHARAVKMDARGKVLEYKMTSQCASGSGQFLENIARYLGVPQAEIGHLSRQGDAPETVSSICAVLAETDVINMVSRGISTPNILRGIHASMAGRFARLIAALVPQGAVFVSGGLGMDEGLLDALREALAKMMPKGTPAVVTHELGIHAGAIGAALWGAYRWEKLGMGGAAWTSKKAVA